MSSVDYDYCLEHVAERQKCHYFSDAFAWANDLTVLSFTTFFHSPKDFPKHYGRVLMACTLDQIVVLSLLYPKYKADLELFKAYEVLVKRGYFPKLLEGSGEAKELIMLVHAGVMSGCGKT